METETYVNVYNMCVCVWKGGGDSCSMFRLEYGKRERGRGEVHVSGGIKRSSVERGQYMYFQTL